MVNGHMGVVIVTSHGSSRVFRSKNCKIYGKIFRQTKFQLILLTKDLEVEVLCNDLLSGKFLISEFGRLIFNSSTDVGYRDHWDQVMIFFNQNF